MIKQNEKPEVKRSPSPVRIPKPPSPPIAVPARLSKSPSCSAEPMGRERKPLAIVSKSASSDNNTKDFRPPIISKSPTSENMKQPNKKWEVVSSKAKQLSPRTPTIVKLHGLEDGLTEAKADLGRGKPSSGKPKEPSPSPPSSSTSSASLSSSSSSSSGGRGSKGSSPSSPSLCVECTRAASEGAVCFIGNDGRVSACTTRSAVRLCKNLNCAANNPEYVAAMASAPKKFLVSKRHQLKALYAPKPRNGAGHLKSPTNPDMLQTPTTPRIHSYSEGEDSSSPQTEGVVADSPAENGLEHVEVLQEVALRTEKILDPEFKESEEEPEKCGPGHVEELVICVADHEEESGPQMLLNSHHTGSCIDEGCSDGAPIDSPAEEAELEDCFEAPTSSSDVGVASTNNEDVLSSAISIIESGPEEEDDQSSSGCMENTDILDGNLDTNNYVFVEKPDLLVGNLGTIKYGPMETTDIVDVSRDMINHNYMEGTDTLDIKSEPCSNAGMKSNLYSVYSKVESGSNGGMANNLDLADSKNDSCIDSAHKSSPDNTVYENKSCSNAGSESNIDTVVINNYPCKDASMEATEDTSYTNHEPANITETIDNDQDENGGPTQTIDKAQDGNGVEAIGKDQGGGMRYQRRRRPLGMAIEEQQNAETVTLRKQQIQERKHVEEWIPNHAIEEVVQKLAPLGETKVKVLVEAFESIISHTEVDAGADHQDGSRTPPPSV